MSVENASDSEALAALGTTPCKHEATALGSHACTKPVSPLAMQVAGLIRTLHDNDFRGSGCEFGIGPEACFFLIRNCP
jgi:hypothetical protein